MMIRLGLALVLAFFWACENETAGGLPCLGAGQEKEANIFQQILGGDSEKQNGLLLECLALTEVVQSSDAGSSSGGTTYSIGGTISGLGNTNTLVLLNNGTDTSNFTGDGTNLTFTVASGVADGTSYAVTVQSTNDADGCNVSSGSGSVSGADVTSISVSCSG